MITFRIEKVSLRYRKENGIKNHPLEDTLAAMDKDGLAAMDKDGWRCCLQCCLQMIKPGIPIPFGASVQS